MKNIYMVQVGFSFDKSVYLPYSVAAIISYCKSIPEIKENYNFVKPIYKRDKIADIVSALESPYMVGFSCYLWNTNFNMALAKAIKEAAVMQPLFMSYVIGNRSTAVEHHALKRCAPQPPDVLPLTLMVSPSWSSSSSLIFLPSRIRNPYSLVLPGIILK